MTQRKVSALALILTIFLGFGILLVRDQFLGAKETVADDQAPAAQVQTTNQTTQGLFHGQPGAGTSQTVNLGIGETYPSDGATGALL